MEPHRNLGRRKKKNKTMEYAFCFYITYTIFSIWNMHYISMELYHNKEFQSMMEKKENKGIKYAFYFHGKCIIFTWNPKIVPMEPHTIQEEKNKK